MVVAPLKSKSEAKQEQNAVRDAQRADKKQAARDAKSDSPAAAAPRSDPRPQNSHRGLTPSPEKAPYEGREDAEAEDPLGC